MIKTIVASLPPLLLLGLVPAQSEGGNGSEVQQLRERVQELERRMTAKEGGGSVDLSDKQLGSISGQAPSDPLSRPWYESIDVWGFGSVSYLNTGDAGNYREGAFGIHESSLFVEAHAWDDTSFFFELQVNRLGKDDEKFVRTGEVHAHFRNIWRADDDNFAGLKVGRVDVPFGEEYLWQDAPDNPLISQSAAYPYGFDEGILLYGKLGGVGWVTSLLDGTDARSADDHSAKTVTAKIYGNVCRDLYLSGSFLYNGPTMESAFEFGGSHIEPVSGSASNFVDASLCQADAVWKFLPGGELALTLGQAKLNDRDEAFDRDLMWFMVQPEYQLCGELYAVARYSEIGTYDKDEGYHFDGKTLAGGNGAFGDEANRFQRVSFGLGWKPNPRTLVKAEVGRDRYEVIDVSSLDTSANRIFFGFQVDVSF